MQDAAIAIENLQHRFTAHGALALANISAQIRRGMITGLVGPDGSGKTTLMRIAAGLLKASAGFIRVDNLDPIRDAAQLHRQVGYMPQKFGLYEDLSVMENLNLYADLRGVTGTRRSEDFARLLHFTALANFTKFMAGKLSGGMKQKLGLACSLLGSPRVLLLDEPSVGIDPISRRELWRLVNALADEGMAIVWSTSYLDEAELCSEVNLMNAGKIEYSGPPQVLIKRMEGRSIQIRNIYGNKREVLQRALRLPEVIDGVIQGSNVRLVLKKAERLPDLLSIEAGPDARLVQVKPRFEDAFIDILGGGPGGDSVLAAHMPNVRLAPEFTAKPVIKANNLTRKFGDFVATDNITFQVARGEIFGLLGPNGAGKSTTFKMMCGLLPPTSGEATVIGIDLKKSASKARQRIGYMAQKFALYGNLSVLQNLQFFSGIYGVKKKQQYAQIAAMVRVFGLKPYLNRTASKLPLGFKQRLALSCAIMHEPQILFLDEPTSGVDPIVRREFWTHINGLVEKGVTVMVTTHFMDEAEYCDRVALIYQGRIIAAGTPDALKNLAIRSGLQDPTMEDTFIYLIKANDATTGGV